MQIGFPAILFFIFLTLKLTSVIDWSWWWVTAPIWVSLGLAALIWLFLILAMWLLNLRANKKAKKRREELRNRWTR